MWTSTWTLTVLADTAVLPALWPIGSKGFRQAGPSTLFRKFVDTPGVIEITAKGVVVRLEQAGHNPLLKGGRD